MSNHLKITDNSGYSPRWLSPEALQVDIDRYFAHIDRRNNESEKKYPPTFQGFCVYVKISTQGFLRYLDYPNFIETIRCLQERIDAVIMEMTASGDIKTPFGIFYLKTRGYIEAGSENKDSNNKPITINLIEAPKKDTNERE